MATLSMLNSYLNLELVYCTLNHVVCISAGIPQTEKIRRSIDSGRISD